MKYTYFKTSMEKVTFEKMEEFITFMKENKMPLTGYNKNTKNRIELQGQPQFLSVYGPMWDGDGIRYESKESYESFST